MAMFYSNFCIEQNCILKFQTKEKVHNYKEMLTLQKKINVDVIIRVKN